MQASERMQCGPALLQSSADIPLDWVLMRSAFIYGTSNAMPEWQKFSASFSPLSAVHAYALQRCWLCEGRGGYGHTGCTERRPHRNRQQQGWCEDSGC